MDILDRISDVIGRSGNIVAFTGAGVSTESNIPDFRSDEGLYEQKNKNSCPPEVMLSHRFFETHPELFYDYYKKNMVYRKAKPNDCHIALSELEKMGKVKAVLTQNIDGLHQAAGSSTVLELHGSVHRNFCTGCRKFFDLDAVMGSDRVVPICDVCGSIIKPDVVLYEEMLDSGIMERSIQYIREAEVLLVMGTSLVVYPAAGFLEYFRGNTLILVNKSATAYDKKADYVLNESVGKVMRAVLEHCKKVN